jgi:hypothetical protein
MIGYIIEKHSNAFQYITHVNTFERLQLKHEQNNEAEKALEHARRDGNGDLAYVLCLFFFPSDARSAYSPHSFLFAF